MSDGPLIVQSDKTLLLEVDHPAAADCRREIAPFAELERSPEHVHTYRLTPLGLWNARAAGHDAEQVVDVLLRFSRYPVPHSLLVDLAETMARYGRLRIDKHPVHHLVLSSTDRPVLEEVLRSKRLAPMLGSASTARRRRRCRAVHPSQRGALKQALLKLGWPAEDYAGLRRRRGAPDRAGRVGSGSCGRTSGRRRTRSGTAGPGWWCSPAVRARHWWARRRWPVRGRPP